MMPKLPANVYPTIDKHALCRLGFRKLQLFCRTNNIPSPALTIVARSDWLFEACAYYRPAEGIQICLDKCAYACGHQESRNWSWPGSVTDREPYGVVAHELGHHCDWLASDKKGRYYGDYSINLRKESGETAITSYCPNDAEWFAEMFRLFVTNPGLLLQLRPKTYSILIQKWVPVGSLDWVKTLGDNVPQRVLRTLRNKGAKP